MAEVIDLARKREEKQTREKAEAEVAVALYENPWFEIFALLFMDGREKEGDHQ